jgi:copper oxidase (laccase) domain-containing protein
MMIPWPEESKVNAVFFDKNLDNLESHLPPQTKIIVLKQTHGTEVISINEKNKDLDLEGDALVTTLSNIAHHSHCGLSPAFRIRR